jgi:peptidoglycan hydrolase-like protein with peptidoglycan-binding domain
MTVEEAGAPEVAAPVSPDEDDFSVQAEEPKLVKKTPAAKKTVVSPKIHVVSGKFLDEVLVSKLVRSEKHRKSLSVHHLQRRLAELGFREGLDGDRDGYYGEPTARAVAAWQKAEGAKGDLDLAQAKKLFDGDLNVQVLP